MLVAMGVPAGQATAADLVWRAASFVPQVLVGAGALLAWSRSATRAAASRTRLPQARPAAGRAMAAPEGAAPATGRSPQAR